METAALLDRAMVELKASLAELRELARGIHPAVLTERGLEPALHALASRAPVPVTLDADGEQRLPAPVEAAAYFVVAEALANVAKYAQATEATVAVRRANGRVTVDVTDDGIGGADAALGSGLRGLGDRVAALDGTLSLESPPGRGTRLHVEIPCDPHRAGVGARRGARPRAPRPSPGRDRAVAGQRGPWAGLHRDQPGGHRVRVPHLAGVELVASPHGPGDGRDEGEEPAGVSRTAGEPAGPADRLDEIRDGPAAPAADLVTKQAQPADRAAPDGARSDHSSARLVGVRRGRDLDRVALAVVIDDERCVVEVASWPMLTGGFDGLEDAAVEADAVTTRAERDPIQVHGCRVRGLHCRL